MHEISISKEFYTLSKKFEYNNYNLAYESVQNSFRTIAILSVLIFNIDLKVMIYILLTFQLIGICLNFKQLEKDDYKPVKE